MEGGLELVGTPNYTRRRHYVSMSSKLSYLVLIFDMREEMMKCKSGKEEVICPAEYPKGTSLQSILEMTYGSGICRHSNLKDQSLVLAEDYELLFLIEKDENPHLILFTTSIKGIHDHDCERARNMRCIAIPINLQSEKELREELSRQTGITSFEMFHKDEKIESLSQMKLLSEQNNRTLYVLIVASKHTCIEVRRPINHHQIICHVIECRNTDTFRTVKHVLISKAANEELTEERVMFTCNAVLLKDTMTIYHLEKIRYQSVFPVVSFHRMGIMHIDQPISIDAHVVSTSHIHVLLEHFRGQTKIVFIDKDGTLNDMRTSISFAASINPVSFDIYVKGWNERKKGTFSSPSQLSPGDKLKIIQSEKMNIRCSFPDSDCNEFIAQLHRYETIRDLKREIEKKTQTHIFFFDCHMNEKVLALNSFIHNIENVTIKIKMFPRRLRFEVIAGAWDANDDRRMRGTMIVNDKALVTIQRILLYMAVRFGKDVSSLRAIHKGKCLQTSITLEEAHVHMNDVFFIIEFENQISLPSSVILVFEGHETGRIERKLATIQTGIVFFCRNRSI